MRCPSGAPERKHRAAVVSAAKKVCERVGEHRDCLRSELPGGTLIFWNRVSVTSYAMARLKSDYLNGYRREFGPSWSISTEEDLKAAIAPGGRDHKYVVEGGAWWKHCQEDIAKFKDLTANQNNAGDDLTIRQDEAGIKAMSEDYDRAKTSLAAAVASLKGAA